MKVVFLDFDGVLNSESFMREAWAARRNGTATQYPSRHTDEICPERAKRVLKICEEADASVVISSSWRILHSLEEIKAMLREVGVPGLADRIIGKTPSLSGTRGYEIHTWLRLHGDTVTGYVILDDDSDMLPEQYTRFVQTDWKTGIEDLDVPLALNMLDARL